jgi:hypothetical protein
MLPPLRSGGLSVLPLLLYLSLSSFDRLRFEAYHHEEGIVKKHHLEEMRDLEQQRAALIGLVTPSSSSDSSPSASPQGRSPKNVFVVVSENGQFVH